MLLAVDEYMAGGDAGAQLFVFQKMIMESHGAVAGRQSIHPDFNLVIQFHGQVEIRFGMHQRYQAAAFLQQGLEVMAQFPHQGAVGIVGVAEQVSMEHHARGVDFMERNPEQVTICTHICQAPGCWKDECILPQ